VNSVGIPDDQAWYFNPIRRAQLQPGCRRPFIALMVIGLVVLLVLLLVQL
jgi:hypothetical protein